MHAFACSISLEREDVDLIHLSFKQVGCRMKVVGESFQSEEI